MGLRVRVGGSDALLKSGGRSRALTLIRTELGRAYSLAGQQRMEQAAEVLPGLKKQWRRSGKLRARLTHDAIDGQLRDADKPFSAAGASLLFPRDPAGPAAETVNCGLSVASLDGELGGPEPRAQGVLGGGDRAQPDPSRAVKLRGVLTISTITSWGGGTMFPSRADRGG